MIGSAMLHHAALIVLITGLAILGFGGIITFATRPKRIHGRHRKDDRESGDTPLTA